MKAKVFFALVITFILSLATNSFAQGFGGMSPEERMKRTLEEYKTKLSLTEEQLPKVEAILKAQTEEMATLRANAGGDREAMRAAITEMRAKTDKKVEELLTDEQKVAFKKLQEERAQRMQGMGRG